METFGQFEFNRARGSIGSGQFGCVYKGTRKTANGSIPIAVKQISIDRNVDTWDREVNVLQEISCINQRNLVRLLEHAFRDNCIYLFMEYCNGGDLDRYIKQSGRLNDPVVAHFARQITDGMKVLHSLNIVHRDLKPQNILLHHVGGGVYMPPLEIVLRITDFGFSRFLTDDQMTCSYLGSPSYMAPEIFLRKSHSSLSDIFSVGVILYFCRFNSLPFPASNETHLKRLYSSDNQPTFPCDTDERMRDMVTRMLKLRPDDRIGFDEWFNHPFLSATWDISYVKSQVRAIQMSSTSRNKYQVEYVGDGLFEFVRDGYNVIESGCYASPCQSSFTQALSRDSASSPKIERKRPTFPSIINELFRIPPFSDFVDIYNQTGKVERSASLPTYGMITPPRPLHYVASPITRRLSSLAISESRRSSDLCEVSFATECEEDVITYSFPLLVDRDLAIEICGHTIASIDLMSDQERHCFDRIMHYVIVLDTHRLALRRLLGEIAKDNPSERQNLLYKVSCLTVRTETILRRFYVTIKETAHLDNVTHGVWKRATQAAIRITQKMIDDSHPVILKEFIPVDNEKIVEDFLYCFVGQEVVDGCKLYLDFKSHVSESDPSLLKSHSCFIRSWHLLYSLAEGVDSEDDKREYKDGIDQILSLVDYMVSKHPMLRPFC